MSWCLGVGGAEGAGCLGGVGGCWPVVLAGCAGVNWCELA